MMIKEVILVSHDPQIQHHIQTVIKTPVDAMMQIAEDLMAQHPCQPGRIGQFVISSGSGGVKITIERLPKETKPCTTQ